MITLNNVAAEELPEVEIREETRRGKPVHEVEVKTVLNFESAFGEKHLCDGAVFSLGTACVYSCAFCYVEAVVRRHPAVHRLLAEIKPKGFEFKDIVITRRNALEILREQLTVRLPRSVDPSRRDVVFTSPLVDPAATFKLAMQTAEACRIIFELTNWDVRILSKSNLLPLIAKEIPAKFSQRLIFGVSTGTLDNGLAKSFEAGTPLVSKRLESLHWLQDHGYRTFGMICPNLPQEDYPGFAAKMAEAIRLDRCEHVWAEVINLRGNSLKATLEALTEGGFTAEAERLAQVCGPGSQEKWEEYARSTFLAHQKVIPAEKLRFLQYVKPATRAWWQQHAAAGAVLLGKAATPD